MAVLESIRKRSLFLILIIGLALFAFVIGDVINKNSFSGPKAGTTVGEINGVKISRDEFVQKVENSARRFGTNVSTTQIVNTVWNQEVRQVLLSQQIEDLGINVGKDQIVSIIKNNPAFTQDPTFQNEAGLFDEQKFIEFIADLKANNPVAYQGWTLQEEALIQNAKEQMYFNLIRAGVGATLKDGELAYKMENDKVDIKFARVPYTSIPDSTITVSKSEIEKYINEHKDEFKEEASRNIQYVYFEEKPSLEDENEAKNSIVSLLENSVEYNSTTGTTDTLAGFKTVTDVEAFLSKHSDIKYNSAYITRQNLPNEHADSIFNLNKGEIYGPYKDAGFFKITRMLDKKERAAVKASHILLAYKGAERASAETERTKEEARAKAQELAKELKSNPDKFAALANEFSDDPGSKNRGGTYDFIPEGQMVKPFNDFIFSKPVGAIDVVETDFGFHVIKVDATYPGVQIATLARRIEPSEETINSLFTEATKFEMEAAEKNFSELAKENNYVVRPVNKVRPLDENLPGLPNQRGIVQWAFDENTEVGEVKRFNVNNGYAIVQLVSKTKEGLASVEDASARVLPILRKQKKAALIIEKNKGKSLENFAKDNNVAVSTASALTMKTPTIPGAGREPKVVGTAFGLAEGATSDLIEGENGVYIIQVTKKTPAPELDNYLTYAKSVEIQNQGRVNTAVYNALREAAEIEDNRADFY